MFALLTPDSVEESIQELVRHSWLFSRSKGSLYRLALFPINEKASSLRGEVSLPHAVIGAWGVALRL